MKSPGVYTILIRSLSCTNGTPQLRHLTMDPSANSPRLRLHDAIHLPISDKAVHHADNTLPYHADEETHGPSPHCLTGALPLCLQYASLSRARHRHVLTRTLRTLAPDKSRQPLPKTIFPSPIPTPHGGTYSFTRRTSPAASCRTSRTRVIPFPSTSSGCSSRANPVNF